MLGKITPVLYSKWTFWTKSQLKNGQGWMPKNGVCINYFRNVQGKIELDGKGWFEESYKQESRTKQTAKKNRRHSGRKRPRESEEPVAESTEDYDDIDEEEDETFHDCNQEDTIGETAYV